jgi:hypothetical protein
METSFVAGCADGEPKRAPGARPGEGLTVAVAVTVTGTVTFAFAFAVRVAFAVSGRVRVRGLQSRWPAGLRSRSGRLLGE